MIYDNNSDGIFSNKIFFDCLFDKLLELKPFILTQSEFDTDSLKMDLNLYWEYEIKENESNIVYHIKNKEIMKKMTEIIAGYITYIDLIHSFLF